MPRIIKSGLIQLSLPKTEGEGTIEEIKEAMVQKHIPYIEEAGKKGVQILCFQEIFNTPYFCPGQDKAWYESAETVPGPTVERMQEYAKKYNMVMIVPMYEKEQPGVLYNTAAVIDADGTYLGKYRKNHIPHTSGFWEKFFFKPGNLGYPVFQTKYAKVGVHLLRSSFSRWCQMPWIEWRRDCLQPICNGCRLVAVPLETGAACTCCCKWIFYGLHQPGGTRKALEPRQVLWKQLFCGSPWANLCTGIRRQRRIINCRF